MEYEKDYIMRLIKQMIRALLMVIFNKREEIESPKDQNVPGGKTENELFALADSGKINEAENRLSEMLDGKDTAKLHIALLFYEHINEYTDEFLKEHQFSRQEILDGIRNAAEMYGFLGLAETLLPQEEL
ncbi:MAG: DUF6483 family protein [Eubacteriales bacterium]|nr:DUF6483 family protein [Eubacteriales bacterium]